MFDTKKINLILREQLTGKILMHLLKLIYYWLKAPDLWDFIDQGQGIEARAERCRVAWQPHLMRSILFQREVFASVPSSARVAVLGAGRLFDLDIAALKAHQFKVDLFDADPGCLTAWRKEAKFYHFPLNENISELTGVLGSWTKKLKYQVQNSRDVHELSDFLKALDAAPPAELTAKLKNYDLILSLNLLGQIPIYWRDRVTKILLKHWKLDSDENGKFGEPLDSAIVSSMTALQLGHLELLNASGAKRIGLITDRSFLYYKNDLTLWQEEPALYSEMETKLEKGFNQLRPVDSASWFWHLAPQGIEQPDYGIIHDVVAYEFERPPLKH